MSESTAAPETVAPVKAPQPEGDAPPTLAEPASGPVAEMSGALPERGSVPVVAEDRPVDAPTTSINGAPEPTPSEPAKPAEEMPASTEADNPEEEPTQKPPAADADAEMKDVETSQPTPAAPEEATASEANGTPANKGKRKSSAAVPEHKAKTMKKKQSKAKITNLDAKPGDLYLARLRSYPPWPSIVCDEEMLPDVLLNSRPVTAIQADGTYKEPYAEGGKKVTDRTYAVMFLHTNEFAWIPNTDLTPIEPEACKDVSEKGKSKPLIEAYKVAAEGHNLDHFKELLMQHDAAMQEEEEKKKERDAQKAEKKKRKSEVKVDDDVEMEDADAAPKKATKKRKKDAGSDDEGPEKPAKTPKTTKLKLTTGKTPTTEKKTKEKATKPKADKKKKTQESEEEVEPEREAAPPVDPVQARKDKEKEVLFLRHKLQKGFLSRDQEPTEDEMPQMATYIKKLEAYGGKLDVQIIRATKINKVLKGIIKLNTIPKDEEYHFKERSVKLLGEWNQLLGAEPVEAEKSSKEDKASPATTNGVHKDAEEKADEKITPTVEEPKDTTMSTEDAVEKISAEVPAEADVKAAVIDEIQKDEKPAEETKNATAVVSEPNPTPAVEDQAPVSAEGAAEANEVVKSTE